MAIKILSQREVHARLTAIDVRMNEIADICERENRAQTDDEAAEVMALEREKRDHILALARANMPAPMPDSFGAFQGAGGMV